MSEPIAWFHEDDFFKGVSLHKDNFVNAIPLYTHPPMRELTEEEILEVWKENYGDVNISNFARAILKKASEK